ncbi:MAG: hypothetical protein R6V00_01035 [Candidatus Aminicenantes bacterium]
MTKKARTVLLLFFCIIFLNPGLYADLDTQKEHQGYTPITYALNLAVKDFPDDKDKQRTILLVSNGKETCEGDPCVTELYPGTVTVKSASFSGHNIYDKNGNKIESVDATANWIPLPPGDYVVEIDGKKIEFSLKQGEDKVFKRE